MNRLKSLIEFGQSLWLDYIRRSILENGDLQRLIDEDGLRGLTSNPTIFEKAIGGSTDYDAALRAFDQRRDESPIAIYEALAIADIRKAADMLRPVYEATKRRDGFVSLEVSPHLALRTDETVAEARRLWQGVARENLMVKVPGTPEGVPAVRQLIGEGINVNVTLLFARSAYEAVAEAYMAGLEDRLARGGDISGVSGVASFFVSRIDTAMDAEIDRRLPSASPADRIVLEELRGKVAIANAKLAYQAYKKRIAGPRWRKLAEKGAQPQRLLWASTGVKNPKYRDTLYAEQLIGRDTVDTMPPSTMDAFRDHGEARPSLEEDIEGAQGIMDQVARLGLPLDGITDELVRDGIAQFREAADRLIDAIERKRAAMVASALAGQTWHLDEKLEAAVGAMLETWRREDNMRRLWAHDATLWTGHDEASWLAWLDIVGAEQQELPALQAFQKEVAASRFSHAVLLGMGGSSLGPEVLGAIFGSRSGFPELVVLDSTDPAEVAAVERRVDLSRTLFIVASKSGTTLEPDILERYFYERAKTVLGERTGKHFIAITDPGSALEAAARAKGYWHVFHGVKAIGGRYSVLSRFGLVPAAIIGLDLAAFLERAEAMVRQCGPDVAPRDNPGAALGIVMGVSALHGRDKLTITASPGIATLGAWLEQLIAESTGKDGRGIVPVDGEPLGPPELYGADRLFVDIRLAGEEDAEAARALAALEAAGHPVVRILVPDRLSLGQEFFRWEIATAVAGAVIGVNPFDQPDVEASKVKTRALTDAYARSGSLPKEEPVCTGDGLALYTDPRNAEALAERGAGRDVASWIAAHFARLEAGDYAALLAYISRSKAHQMALQRLRRRLRDRRKAATPVGFGPRFLHSTGQAYKGGPGSGVFLQITCDDAADLPVPGRDYTFGIVKAAQARGDFEVLAERGRRALRVHLGADVAAGLAKLEAILERVL